VSLDPHVIAFLKLLGGLGLCFTACGALLGFLNLLASFFDRKDA
jgi:hypothetical protein